MSLFLAFGIITQLTHQAVEGDIFFDITLVLTSFLSSQRKAPNKGHKVDLDLMGYISGCIEENL